MESAPQQPTHQNTTSCQDSTVQQDTSTPNSFQENNYDFYIYTDGSGLHTDHIGGFGAVVLSPKHPQPYIVSCGCSTHMETGRAEFTAMLTALHSIFDAHKWTKLQLEVMRKAKLNCLIVADREDLVGSINNIYGRKANQDLWCQFEWYTQYMNITAQHIPRDTHVIHRTCDSLASQMRIVLIDFLRIQKDCEHI